MRANGIKGAHDAVNMAMSALFKGGVLPLFRGNMKRVLVFSRLHLPFYCGFTYALLDWERLVGWEWQVGGDASTIPASFCTTTTQ